jgi:hypothetical protein
VEEKLFSEMNQDQEMRRARGEDRVEEEKEFLFF